MAIAQYRKFIFSQTYHLSTLIFLKEALAFCSNKISKNKENEKKKVPSQLKKAVKEILSDRIYLNDFTVKTIESDQLGHESTAFY